MLVVIQALHRALRALGHMISTAQCTRCTQLMERVRFQRERAEQLEEALTAVWRAEELRFQLQHGKVQDFTLWEMALKEAKRLYLTCYGITSS